MKTFNSIIPPNYGENHHNPPSGKATQLELFPLSNKRQKPQISSIPGVSIKERRRYRVKLENVILGDRLTIGEALELAKRGEA